MLKNRSMPACKVIPVLPYPDVAQAIDWLCQAFGFTPRLLIGHHRAQLNVGDEAVILFHKERPGQEVACSVMVRVEDVDRHSAISLGHGARMVSAPTDYVYGERQYTVEDIAGHHWTFSQSITDSDPQEWGAASGTIS